MNAYEYKVKGMNKHLPHFKIMYTTHVHKRILNGYNVDL